MESLWEYILNRPPNTGEETMNLEGILSTIQVKDNKFNFNQDYPTIRYITKEEYTEDVYKYTEPIFNDASSSSYNVKFILFSAPGATGKTALAKHICYKKNGVYWDLPDNKVAEYSFEGAISKAVGFSHISSFVESIENGENFFVIDGFDEAEAGSGRSGIEFFLRDLNEVTKNCNHICAILMARTESAIFIKRYLLNNNISFKHYEVGLFAEYNAKSYIKNRLERYNVRNSEIVNQCIDEQFREIKRIFSSNDALNFIGYAPVLDALATSYDEERNTLNLLKSTSKGENNCILMNKILQRLITRERDKFIKALTIKISKISEFSNDKLYDLNEQINRLFGIILLSDSTIFAEVDKSIPVEYHEDYLEAVNTQLPQHPFIKAKEHDNHIIYDFTGAAFRDFIIAYCLSDLVLSDFIDDYLASNIKYCPSQMLIEFYGLFSANKVKGKYIPLMYNSFKSFAQLGDKISVYINGDETDCSVEFNLRRNNNLLSVVEFKIIDLEDGICINQLSNCFVDIEGKIFVGNSTGEARINNSVIHCTELIWRSEQVSIEAYSPGECVLIADKFSYVTNTIPRFEIRTDDKKNVKICSSSLKSYFKLLAYKSDDFFDTDYDDFNSFSNLLRRIFSCLRSHSKDTPARKMDYIDNRIIGKNTYKKVILDFLLSEHILFTDEQDWLYKLDTTKLSQFSINWNEIREGEFKSLNSLYNMYKK